jgi:hypothetical protein
MFNKSSKKKHKINYIYSDANIIHRINNYLSSSNCELDIKIIKLSWDMINKRIKIVFKSDFETRRLLADKLRELDNGAIRYFMKEKFYLHKPLISNMKKKYKLIKLE